MRDKRRGGGWRRRTWRDMYMEYVLFSDKNVVRRSIRELDFGTKVVLEAISLHPTHFFFDDIMYLLDVEKAHNALLSPPEYDEAAMNQFTERCHCLARMLYHQSRQQLRRVCKDKLKLLMKAAMIVKVADIDGCYELDSFIRQVALSLFRNPLDD